MSRSGAERCEDVRRSVFLVNSYLADRATARERARRTAFDHKTRDAVIYRLIVIGESAKFLLSQYGVNVARRSTGSLST